jgi:hypothetical protein
MTNVSRYVKVATGQMTANAIKLIVLSISLAYRQLSPFCFCDFIQLFFFSWFLLLKELEMICKDM